MPLGNHAHHQAIGIICDPRCAECVTLRARATAQAKPIPAPIPRISSVQPGARAVMEYERLVREQREATAGPGKRKPYRARGGRARRTPGREKAVQV